MIDRRLNYGRAVIKSFLSTSMPYNSILDIGAGYGNDLLLAKEVNPSCDLFALECYDPAIQTLRQLDISVNSIDIEKQTFPYPDKSFDIVMSNQLLEHVKEIFWIFHEMSRVLKVGGKLIIGVPNLASLHNRLLLCLGKQPTSIKTASAHIRGYTKDDLLFFVEDCFPGGYELKGFAGSNFYPFPPMVARPLAKCFPSMAWSIFFLLEKKRDYDCQFINYPTAQTLETNYFCG